MISAIKEFLIKNKVIAIVVLVIAIVFAGVFGYYYFRRPINLTEESWISKLNKGLQIKKSDKLTKLELIKSMTATSTASNYSDLKLESIIKSMTAKPGSKSNLSQKDRQKLIDSMTAK